MNTNPPDPAAVQRVCVVGSGAFVWEADGTKVGEA